MESSNYDDPRSHRGISVTSRKLMPLATTKYGDLWSRNSVCYFRIMIHNIRTFPVSRSGGGSGSAELYIASLSVFRVFIDYAELSVKIDFSRGG